MQGAAERIAIVTGVPTSPCTNPYGDYFLGISLRNKQDYARLHDYVFILGTHKADPKLENMWNKIGEGQRGALASADWWPQFSMVVMSLDLTPTPLH